MKPIVYIAIDIEADGPCPGLNSMMAMGAVAYDAEFNERDTFYGVFERLEGAAPDPETTAWWLAQPREIFNAARDGARPAATVMLEFMQWINRLEGTPIAVMAPVGFDWPFIYYYCERFLHYSPFGFRTRDINQLAEDYFGGFKYRREWPEHWFTKELPHTHHALDDARQQGFIFCQIMKDMEGALNAQEQ